MSWMELLQDHSEHALPWTGSRTLRDGGRTWQLVGPVPDEHGWQRFVGRGGRRVAWVGPAVSDPDFGAGRPSVVGYLVGDRLLPDGASVPLELAHVHRRSRRVHLVAPGLERFARVRAVDIGAGTLIFAGQEFPLGPEGEVLEAWQDGAASVASIPGVTPSLELAFLWLRWRREIVQARRAERRELERLQQAIDELELQELREHQSLRQAELSRVPHRVRTTAHPGDRDSTVRSALSRSEAELLDVRPAVAAGELVIQFRFQRRRFECVATWPELRIVDAGVCLEDGYERGDDRFTVESLPGVIRQAMSHGLLHVTRPI